MPSNYIHLSDYNPDGTLVGQNASDKIGFFGTTPVVQQANIAAAVKTVTATPVLTVVSADLDTVRTKLNTLLTELKNLGIIASV